jgi:hypothetical protein
MTAKSMNGTPNIPDITSGSGNPLAAVVVSHWAAGDRRPYVKCSPHLNDTRCINHLFSRI